MVIKGAVRKLNVAVNKCHPTADILRGYLILKKMWCCVEEESKQMFGLSTDLIR